MEVFLQYIQEIDSKTITNILLVASTLFIVFYMFLLLMSRRKKEQLLSLHIKKNSAQKLGDRFKFVGAFYDDIESSMKKKGNEAMADIVFYSLIVFSLLVAIAMIATGQFLLAIVYPIFLLWFIRKILQISKKDPIVEMEENLPSTIDNMIRILSRYSDIKSIIYETSLVASGPLKEELDWLSRQMNSRNPLLVLEEFSEKHNSVWLNNFAFTLIGYLQDSSKEETIRNLRHLRTILEQENRTKKNAISERKPSLMVNYTLAVLGIGGAFANILFNPVAFDFFFHSYTGLICFTGGFGFVLGTIYMNVKMMKIEK